MSKLWLLLFALTPLLKGEVKQQVILPNDYEVIEENTFIANSPIIPQTQTFGMVVDNVVENITIQDIDIVEESIINNDYISCLAKCESNFNPDAIGDNGKANGILQFWQSTYNHFCVNEYGFLESDYKNPEVQIQCCDKMLSAGLKNHWTCSKVCDNLYKM